MSTVGLLLLAGAAVMFLPPLISGFAGKSLKFTSYYAAAVAVVTAVSRIAHYYQNGLGPEQNGMPPLPDYAVSQIGATLLSFVATFGLFVAMYWLGRLIRHSSAKLHH